MSSIAPTNAELRKLTGPHDDAPLDLGHVRLWRRLDGGQAGWTMRRMTVFFIPLGRTNSKPASSYIARVPS
jgi:hypothetical protein